LKNSRGGKINRKEVKGMKKINTSKGFDLPLPPKGSYPG